MDGNTRPTDGYGYWFPLVLLGFGLLTLLGVDNLGGTDDVGWFAHTPESSVELHAYAILTPGAGYYYDYPPGRSPWDGQWPVLIGVVLVGTVAWYAVRARRAGGSVRGHVAVAVGGIGTIAVCHVAAAIAGTAADPGELIRSVAVPLAGLGVLAGVLGARRRILAVAGVVCLAAAGSMAVGAWAPELLEPLLVTFGLLALARYERSRLVAVVAVAVLAALLLFPVGILNTLVPAVLVFLAAIAALLRRGVRADPGASPS